jgi:hypothetical protein
MGLENLKQAIDEGRAYEPILASEATAASEEKLSDETALKYVVQDANFAVRFLQSKTLAGEWNLVDDLVRCYVAPKTWPNSGKQRSNLPMPLILEVIETLVPQCHMAFFSDPQPFLLDPKGKTSPLAVRAVAKLLGWGIDQSGFQEEIRKAIKGAIQYGTTVVKRGWKNVKYAKKEFKHLGDGTVGYAAVEHDLSVPTLEWIDLRNLLVDPATRSHDITKSRYRIHQIFTDANGLEDLAKDPTYKNVPSMEQLKAIMAEQAEAAKDTLIANKAWTWREQQAERENVDTSGDPLKKPLEILEWESDDRIITVLQRCIVIRNEPNEEGCHYRSCAFIDVLNSFYGFGAAKLLEGEQRLEVGTANAWVDSLNLTLFPSWQRKNGVGTRTQNISISPGKVVSENGELVPLEVKSVTQEAMAVLQASESRAARRVGANFGNNAPNQTFRTAEGVQAFTSGVQEKLQYFIETFSRMVFIPILQDFICMFKENLTPEEINALLSEEDGKAYSSDVLEIYNGKYEVSVLSSTKLAGRRAMQQLIPIMLQTFGQPAIVNLLGVQGKKIDFVEFFNQVGDVSGWPMSSIIVDMTPEDIQRQQMSNPAVVNAQAKQQQAQQDQQNSLEQIQAKGEASAGVAVVKHVLKSSSEQAKMDAQTAAMAKPLALQQPK